MTLKECLENAARGSDHPLGGQQRLFMDSNDSLRTLAVGQQAASWRMAALSLLANGGRTALGLSADSISS